MKKLLIFIAYILILSSCQNKNEMNIPEIDETIKACGVSQPQINLLWLKELIKKAETDKTGNYIGTIWLIKYKEQDIFVTDMALGSGGIANYFFDCSGNHLVWREGEGYCPSDFVGNNHFFVEDEEDFGTFFHAAKLNVIIYTNVPL
jgi:hypothetical protein